MKEISTVQLMLLSTGGMIGAGWLFSPYYGFQTAGAWVVLSWIIVAIMTFFIGLSFAEVSTILPIVGGVSRFMGITHNKNVSFLFLLLGWLSYVVYLPLEIQSCIQYLGYWFDSLVVNSSHGARLSYYGLGLAFFVMVLLTKFNTLFLSKVSKVNSIISIWKIIIPLLIAWTMIVKFGNWHNVNNLIVSHKFSFEDILLAITSSGLAFAFTGFQNGLILANSVANPNKSIPYSLFTPIIFGFILYCSLSLVFIFCIGSNQFTSGASAPLLGLVGLFSIHIIFTILFIDAVISPLGTANVYTAITSRILLSMARDFLPNSMFTRLNKNLSPAYCLWFNLIVGVCFLLPFPTWQELVDFLSSVVIFAYLSGPITLMVLRNEMPYIPRAFRLHGYRVIGFLGFIFCSLLIYWSGLNNLLYLSIAIIIITIIYGVFVNKNLSVIRSFGANAFILVYVLLLLIVSYLRKINVIIFPVDNIFIIVISFFACKVFLAHRLSNQAININISRYNQEFMNNEEN